MLVSGFAIGCKTGREFI